MIHRSVVEVFDDGGDTVRMVIQCPDCGTHEITVPKDHLTTFAATASAYAARLGKRGASAVLDEPTRIH